MTRYDERCSPPAPVIDQHRPVVGYIEQTAQALYNPNVDVAGQCFELEENILNYYDDAGMVDHTPAKAAYSVLRGVRQALFAPLGHMVQVEISRSLLPYLRDGGSLADMAGFQEDTFDDLLQVHSLSRSEWQDVMRPAAAYVVSAAVRTLPQPGDSKHPYSALWDRYSLVHKLFVQAEKEVRGYDRDPDPYRNFVTFAAENFPENAMIVQSYLDLLEGRPALQESGGIILARAESISWASSTNRHKVATMLGNAADAAGSPEKRGKCPYRFSTLVSDSGVVIPAASDEGVWSDRSLQDGPWRLRHYCPANIPLVPFNPEDQDVVEEMYEAQQVYTGGSPRLIERRGYGVTNTAELHLINLGFFALAAQARHEATLAA